jgi:membrane fusion protein, multidrug efflux system
MRTCSDYERVGPRPATCHPADPPLLLLADARLIRKAECAVWRSGDAGLGYLSDCGERCAGAILRDMFTRLSTFQIMQSPRVTVLIVGLSLVAATLVTACARVQSAAAPPPLPQVTAAAAIPREVTEWDEFTGRLEAVQSVGVRPRVSGLVSSVSFEEGSMVRQGQLLFQLDDRPFVAQVERLRAELAQARAAHDRAGSETRRAERLATENAMSLEERERRAGAATEATAHVDAVAAALRAAELDLEFTKVVSPIDGRVSRALVTRGNLVSGGQGEATLLTTLVSVDPIYASFDADEQTFLRYGDRVRQRGQGVGHGGLPIQMALADEQTFPHEGTLQFLDNQLDPSTGTIRGRAVFRNAERRLTPGLFVRLRLPGTLSYPGVLVEDRAVGTDLDRRFVLVVNREKTIESRTVTLGPVIDGLRVVRQGLTAGELVVVNGLQRVRPGVQANASVVTMGGGQ